LHARTLRVVTVLVTLGWLALVTVPYGLAAWESLKSGQFLGCAQARGTIAVAAAVVTVALLVAMLAPVRVRQLALRIAFGLAGLAGAEVAVLSDAAWPVVATGWLLLLAWATAGRLLRLLFPPQNGPEGGEHAVLAIAVGLGITSHFGLLLAASGLVDRWLLVTIMLAGTVLLGRDMWMNARFVAKAVSRAAETLATARRAWFTVPIGAYLAVFSVLVLVQAIAPEIQYDSLNYHLTVPRIFIEHHGLLATPWIMQSWFAAGTEMDYLVAMLLASQTAAKLVNLAFFAVTIGLVYAFTRRHLGPGAGLPAIALFATTPLVAWEGSTTYTDLPLACFCLAAVAATARWLEDRRNGWLVLAGLFAGFAVSSKINAVLFLAPVGAVVIAIALLQRGTSRRDRTTSVLAFTGPAFAAALPWPLVRFMQTGNPVFPFLNGIFKSPLWPAVNERLNFGTFGIGTGLPAFAQLPWAMTFHTAKFAEAVPPGVLGVGLLALPLLVFARRWTKPIALVTLTLGVFGLSWALTVQYLRYFFPGLPLLCILVGGILTSLDDSPSTWLSRVGGVTTRAVAVVWMLAALPLWIAMYWRIPERIPYGVATGQESRSSYLSRTVASYDAYQRLNASHAPADVHVVAVGDEFRFYADGKVESLITSQALKPLMRAHTAEETLACIRREGITHLLVNRAALSKGLDALPLLQQSFLDANAALEFAGKNVFLYRFLSKAEAASRPAAVAKAELLANPGFEERGAGGVSAWGTFGSPVLDATSTQSHTGRASVKVGTKSGFYQTLKITPGTSYVLSHFSRAASPDCSVRGQVNWLDEHGQIKDVTIAVWPCTQGWTQHQVTGMAPANAVTAIVFANTQRGEAWVDDYSFTAVR
jgi:hypothetical protein